MNNIIENSLNQVDEVLTDPAPQILCWELGATSLAIKVRWWINSQRSQEVVSRSRVVQAIKEAFDANDIDPTDPQLIYYQNTEENRQIKDNEERRSDNVITVPSPPEINISKGDPESDMPKIDLNEQTLLKN